ncbi:MAG: aldehyde dehydrogenase family protein [Micavibrio sp.]
MANPALKASTATIISTNPGENYAVLGEVTFSTPAEIAEAVTRARAAFPAWRDMGVAKRVEALRSFPKLVTKHREEIAAVETAEMGKPITEATVGIDWALNHINWYLDHAESSLAPEINFEDETQIHEAHYEPWGVAAIIVPWNFPFSNFVLGAFQSLLAGNTVVFKTSEECPLFGQLLDKIFAESGLPKGVFNQVYGDGSVGEMLVNSDIDMIGFTGSTATGQKLYKIAAEKFIPVHLELGGSDAGIVFEDADIDASLEAIYWAKFVNCGQICCGLKRLIVHESRFDETVEKLSKFLQTRKVGNPKDTDTSFGPLAAKRQLDLLKTQVQDALQKGAKIITGGKEPQGLQGAYYEPTLLTNVTRDMRVWEEEVFGPVLPVVSFKTEDEAVKLANDTPYGLSGYIFTADSARAKRIALQMETGGVSQNGVDKSAPYNPFGGYKLSGMKKTAGKQGFRDCSRLKSVCLQK